MKYDEVETPSQLLDFMNDHIMYGFKGTDEELYTEDDSENFKFGEETAWKLSSPSKVLEDGYGICWDQVEFERQWFVEHDFVVKTLFMWFELDHENPYTTHTFLIYEEENKYCLFEHADCQNRGIKKFDSYKDALYYQIENHLKSNKKIAPMTKDIVECLHIYEYQKPPFEINKYDFIDFILDTGVQIL